MMMTTRRLTAVLILAALCFFKSSTAGADKDEHADNCVAYLYEDATNLLASNDPRGPIVYGYDAQNVPKHRYPDPNTECIYGDGDALLHLSCAEERIMILRGPVQDHRDYSVTYLYHKRTNNPRADGSSDVERGGLGIHGEDPAVTRIQSATRIRCTREVEPIFIDVSKGDLSQGQRYQTGYFVTPVDFLRVMEFKLAPNGNLVVTATLTPAASLMNEMRPAQTPRYGWGLPHHSTPSGKLLAYDSVYSEDNQRRVFKGQWPELEDIEERINPEQKLVRTQLISDEDFYYHNEKSASYFYENTVPVWRSVAEGNWARVGRIMRDIAAQTNSEFELGATSYGSYRRPGRGNGRVELADSEEAGEGYLRVPVPWVLQRYMVDKRNPRRGIVFHVINNPFLTLTEVREYMAERPRCRMVECHMATGSSPTSGRVSRTAARSTTTTH
ncbi:unnamed protein product [Trichogramma brassicae]|uniref:DNA/RNA non-specific endonuclease domain-containing protein n=1 Tax=Trichogramma brassicae TaxID=86971 RepID=A0A6H5J4E2_9HYME|nr:unnamed protein product [Trichogramma brassicae]